MLSKIRLKASPTENLTPSLAFLAPSLAQPLLQVSIPMTELRPN